MKKKINTLQTVRHQTHKKLSQQSAGDFQESLDENKVKWPILLENPQIKANAFLLTCDFSISQTEYLKKRKIKILFPNENKPNV